MAKEDDDLIISQVFSRLNGLIEKKCNVAVITFTGKTSGGELIEEKDLGLYLEHKEGSYGS